MSQASFDVIVIGEGVSGLAAAGMLASSKLNVATMEAQLFGGLVIKGCEKGRSAGDQVRMWGTVHDNE